MAKVGRTTVIENHFISQDCLMVMEISAQSLSQTAIMELLADAQSAELARNLEQLQTALEPIWPNVEQDPNFEHLPIPINAQLLRFCGFFLAFAGKSRGVPSYHPRAKNLLTRAAELFEGENSNDRAAEARVMLALAYWYGGEIEEAEIILNAVRDEFNGNQLHPVYLQIRINQLMILIWKRTPESISEGLQIIDEITIPMEFCTDARHLANFHNQAGILFRLTSQQERALFHLQEAIRISRGANNMRFVGTNLNNLAMVLKSNGRHTEAIAKIDEAIDIFEGLNDKGWLPHAYDTKALILLDMGQADDALLLIDRAIILFRLSEDFGVLCEALWVRCQSLFHLERTSEGFEQFGELIYLARERIGRSAVEKYCKALSEITYIKRGLPLLDESNLFMRVTIDRALRVSHHNPKDAAKLLQFHTESEFKKVVSQFFPDLMPGSVVTNGNGHKRQHLSPDEFLNRDILRVTLPKGKQCRLEAGPLPPGSETFYCSERLMSDFGIYTDALVAVVLPEEWQPGMLVVYNHDGEYYAGRIQRDKLTGVDYVPNEHTSGALALSEIAVVGAPIGWIGFTSTSSKLIKFLPMPACGLYG